MTKKAGTASKQGTKKLKGNCFTIMPFGTWFDEYYATVFKPAITCTGLTAHRADDLYRPSQIIGDIWTFTVNADVILADLTGKNPNVLYELGLAHAIAKPAVLVTEDIDDIPFDLRSLRVIEYDKNDCKWGSRLKTDIAKALVEVMENPADSVPPTFIDVASKKKTTVSIQEKRLLQMRQDIDALRREVAMSGRDVRRPSLRPEEAEKLIREYVDMGMPLGLIVRRLAKYGVPQGFVRKRVAAVKEE